MLWIKEAIQNWQDTESNITGEKKVRESYTHVFDHWYLKRHFPIWRIYLRKDIKALI